MGHKVLIQKYEESDRNWLLRLFTYGSRGVKEMEFTSGDHEEERRIARNNKCFQTEMR